MISPRARCSPVAWTYDMIHGEMRVVAGKIAFVTGGVSGIGLGIAKAFATAGMKVAISYRRKDHLADAMSVLGAIPGATIHPIELDVTDAEAFVGAVAEVERAFGKLHVLCNNAGIMAFGAAHDGGHAEWTRVLSVNLFGAVHGVSAAVPRMLAHGEGGHVINIGSASCLVAWPGTGVYSTSKFALRGFTESLRVDLAGKGIGVTLVCPGLTRTNLASSLQADRAPRRPSSSSAHSPTGWLRTRSATRRSKRSFSGDFYAITHPELAVGIREVTAEQLEALPDETPDPKRLALEQRYVRLRDAAVRAQIDPK